MKKNFFIMLFLGISIGVISSSCKPEPAEPDSPEPSPVEYCSPDKLVAPSLIPVSDEECTDAGCVTSSTPTLSVYYVALTAPQPSTNTDCIPEETHFYLSTGPDYLDEIGGFSPTQEWNVTVPLQPGKKYRWAAAGVSKSIEGPLSPYDYFIAGPICTVSQMIPATQLEPSDGSIVDTLLPTYKWENQSSCTPFMYTVEWATKPFSISFDSDGWLTTETKINEDIFNPVTSLSQSEHTPLEDCETYYWRIRSSVLGSEQSSDLWTFTVQLPGSTCVEVPLPIEEFPPPDFIGLKNANCRSNPWINGNEVGLLSMGDTTTLLGLNEDASWGFFKLINERECWVHMSAVEIQPPDLVFNPALYPVIKHDPPPESESTGETTPGSTVSCSSITDTRACEANSACSWDSRANACKAK
ncbi:MAG: hypothetical protein HN736_04210 [Anaerolineae bacterium]|jgi:hypothetical protein|nr:hypothetical protein [Anaerolineae bacterium]MBT4310420.1 hypothetical protein [Anaerolineae bacterium]MBT4842844.1 hypothetical protein [Anaerolineae bacterium]MBT6061080.1 hypothetical protein [Anaerolineae bacterium]MBT6321257.1 hypothetical protein [Anaerolineae bacterium]